MCVRGSIETAWSGREKIDEKTTLRSRPTTADSSGVQEVDPDRGGVGIHYTLDFLGQQKVLLLKPSRSLRLPVDLRQREGAPPTVDLRERIKI